LAKRRAWYPKVLGSIPTFSTKHVTCLSPAVGGFEIKLGIYVPHCSYNLVLAEVPAFNKYFGRFFREFYSSILIRSIN
jgi:hypothetical protein